MSGPIRVVLVDDQALIRIGLAMIVDAQADMRVVGEAADGLRALEVLATTPCDVVLMDVRMPRLDGVEATRRILARDREPAPRVLVLTTFDLDEHAFAALRAGASGFLLKDAQPHELVAALRAVAAGEAVLTPRVTRQLLLAVEAHLPGAREEQDALQAVLGRLTARERQVLAQVARGLSNAEVAERLVLSEATVKGHVGHLLAKLGLRDRVQAVVWAYRAGVVSPSDPVEPVDPVDR